MRARCVASCVKERDEDEGANGRSGRPRTGLRNTCIVGIFKRIVAAFTRDVYVSGRITGLQKSAAHTSFVKT